LETANISKRKLRMAMIGGGGDGFIGPIHRRAAALCGNIELVAGAFSSDADRSRQCGEALFLSPDRVYGDYTEMLSVESARAPTERIDFVSIVTPNHLHYEMAHLALQSNVHVICDKPVTRTLQEALSLQTLVRKADLMFGLTHTYIGYPLVSQARRMIARGEFGKIRKILVEYPQGWLSRNEEADGNKQAAWRTDPKLSGDSGCIADIGTHAHNLAEYVTGHRIVEVSADLTTFVPGRDLDDDGSALFRTDQNAKGVLTASQICAGINNGLQISVFGESGGCTWQQENPNILKVHRTRKPDETYHAGSNVSYLDPEVRAAFITPAGHPEGYIEAFANLYRSFADRLNERIFGCESEFSVPHCPNIDDGVRGMEFVDAMVASSENGGQWTSLKTAQLGDCGADNGAAAIDSQAEGLETT